MAEKSASTPDAAAVTSRWSRLWRKKARKVNPQLKSPLFTKLPQELRDHIWQIVFEPIEDARPAHFHIYDEVYDACTYQSPMTEENQDRAKRRKAKNLIAVLMSCRKVYQEALPYLYDQSDFTFVVCAGLPRDHCSRVFRDRCKSIGKLPIQAFTASAPRLELVARIYYSIPWQLLSGCRFGNFSDL